MWAPQVAFPPNQRTRSAHHDFAVSRPASASPVQIAKLRNSVAATYNSHVLAGAQTWVVATRPESPSRRATISDVAREAGVNKGTVSRALRGVPGVGPRTRERILEAANRLDFSASHLASALATGNSRTVGIVLPTLRSWYFSDVAAGASEILIPAGFRVELINLDVDSDFLEVDSPQFAHLLRELGTGRGRAALLYAGTISIEDESGDSGSAHVPVSAADLPMTSVPGIYIDHREGGRLIGEHLLGLGHRDIGVLDGRMPGKPPSVWDLRTDGLRDAVREHGFDIDNADVVLAGDCHAPDGERAMQTIIDSGRPLPTAIFCHSDEMAYGALSALRQAGIRCPEEVSVAGFDGHPLARYWGLTTVDQHAHQQGLRAAKALIAALGGAPDGLDEDQLQVRLVVGVTTAPPRSA
jgi:LacI family repressor for deo operon, udp, cdd, tsx, nupC, and nupG